MTQLPPRLFHIKICGVTRVEDVQAIVAAGADAVGFNFYPHSSRYVAIEQAAELAAHCPQSVQRVGVFVNASLETMREAVAQCRLDWIQLHGEEPPETAARLAPWPVLRAHRVGDEGLADLLAYLTDAADQGREVDAVLLDAARAGHYGGTGHTINWTRLAALLPQLGQRPWILAGGLTPDNVAAAIEQLRPLGVDTASGVESAPGIKDADAVRAFVRAARDAWSQLDSRPN